MSEFPQNLWYPLFLSREIQPKPQRFERFGKHWAVFRLPTGRCLMVLDRCPHLGARLSEGIIRDDQIECPFHGFCFDATGQCTHIPALGSHAKIPAKLQARILPLEEHQGWVWGWWGNGAADPKRIPIFDDIDHTWRWGDDARDWHVHVTRAIENQLDVAHIPFVHRRTIGAGGRTLVEGPYVEADGHAIKVWVTNRKDDGQPTRTLQELKAIAKDTPAQLEFRFPGLWQLRIHPKLRLHVAFVPVNPEATRLYVRACHRLTTPAIGALYSWLLRLSNRWIIREDERVVQGIVPRCSLDAHEDALIPADRAIRLFRKYWRQHLERPSVS